MSERSVVVVETAVARVLTVSLEPVEEEEEEEEEEQEEEVEVKEEGNNRRYSLTIRTELELARPRYFWKVHAHARACLTYEYGGRGEKTLGCSSALDDWARGGSDATSKTTVANHHFPASIVVPEDRAPDVLIVRVHLFGITWEPLLAGGRAEAAAVV